MGESNSSSMHDHGCLRNISRVFREHRVSNVEVKHNVLGKYGKSVDDVVNLHQLGWLERLLSMPNRCRITL